MEPNVDIILGQQVFAFRGTFTCSSFTCPSFTSGRLGRLAHDTMRKHPPMFSPLWYLECIFCRLQVRVKVTNPYPG